MRKRLVAIQDPGLFQRQSGGKEWGNLERKVEKKELLFIMWLQRSFRLIILLTSSELRKYLWYKITSNKNKVTVRLLSQLDGLLANFFQRYPPEFCTVASQISSFGGGVPRWSNLGLTNPRGHKRNNHIALRVAEEPQGTNSSELIQFANIDEDSSSHHGTPPRKLPIRDILFDGRQTGLPTKLILDAPIVTLKMGSSLDPKRIKEGDDVYFECTVRSNPRAYKLTWFHEEEELHHDVTAGIVLSDHSLVLQSITRESAGRYTCMATNLEGHESSNIVNLEVMFSPICKHVLNFGGWRYQNATPPPFNVPEDVHGALKHETISLVCEVEANPTTVTFHWTFNSSGDLNDIPSTKYSSESTISRLNYTPSTDMDYGTLGCWASNVVGQSKQPCLYQVIAAGRPYPLQNCTAYNQSDSWIKISCVEGYDGGLPQKFVAIVDKQRFESLNPFWELKLHKPTTVALYAVNVKGSSDPVIMEGVALKGVAKYTGATYKARKVRHLEARKTAVSFSLLRQQNVSAE
ncbi:hypothetical protein HZH66_009594 [Vespula vulgaris]|uniref:Ig-like domain-containing protein n=1 Tax=Vespula vulgaris TaxID=7454 RepID=A0A834N123_VESVU|nr:hypothetical protein HZH66_009594 [Vespula vulgaris]